MGVLDYGSLSDEQWFALYGEKEEKTEEEKKKERISELIEAVDMQRRS